MITLFTIPKSFVSDDASRQRNAIRSWIAAFNGRAQILLYGDDPGVAESAAELGVEHVPGIETNEYGTPYLDWAFRDATERAENDVLCYVNADIIIPETFAKAIVRIRLSGLEKFLAIGRRYDVDVDEELDAEADNWGPVCQSLLGQGVLASEYAIDYFCFTRGLFTDLPHFLVGRPSWDNWLIGHALQMKLPIVEISQVAPVIHQNHGYGHVKNNVGNKWDGPEGEDNKRIIAADGWKVGDLLDAPLALTDEGVVPNVGDQVLWRRLKRLNGQVKRMTGFSGMTGQSLVIAKGLMKLRNIIPGTVHKGMILRLTQQ